MDKWFERISMKLHLRGPIAGGIIALLIQLETGQPEESRAIRIATLAIKEIAYETPA